MKNKKTFTLVELIIVIAIIAILAVTAFLLLTKWLAKARDSSRASDLANLQTSLQIYLTESSKLPMPESYATISSSGTTLGYQGVFGESSKDAVGNISIAPKDPNDKEYYLYYVDSTYKKYQIGAFNENEISYNSNSVNAVDYSKRYFNTKGDKLGILLDTNQTPINQSLTGLDVSTGDTTYTAYFDNSNKLSGTGLTLQWLQSVVNNGGNGFDSPKDCPTGFIPVPGNKDFNQPGFCVAKYEMKQKDGDAGYLSGKAGATVRYTGSNSLCTAYSLCRFGSTSGAVNTLDGKIESKANGNPISSLNQATAIQACNSMGNGYHLITNNEWMTIARNIEAQAINWNSGIVGSGYIYDGNCDGTYTGWRSRPADSNDSNGCSDGLGGILSGCNVSISTNNQRTLKFSNGQVIRDLAGNLWEFVNKNNTINGTGYNTPLNSTILPVASSVVWWNNASALPWVSLYGPKNSGLYRANGIGNFRNPNEATDNIFIRGGGRDLQGGGIYALSLNYSDFNATEAAGFRCAR